VRKLSETWQQLKNRGELTPSKIPVLQSNSQKQQVERVTMGSPVTRRLASPGVQKASSQSPVRSKSPSPSPPIEPAPKSEPSAEAAAEAIKTLITPTKGKAFYFIFLCMNSPLQEISLCYKSLISD
jgi:hypothetical protein